VHCRAGVSRSATLVVAYLMIWKGMTSREALAYTLERRNIRPNWGFLKQLAKLDSRLKKERASSICKGDDSANLKSLSTPCPSNSDMQ
jgi:protein-tyrosine phosphatase